MAIQVFLAILCALFGLFVYQTFLRDRLIRARSFPASWSAILDERLPVYAALAPPEQRRLQQLIQLFIAKKRFYGCAGLEITEEIKVTIAAQACLLLLNRGWSVYPKLSAILVYPEAFRVQRDQHSEGIVSATSRNLSGESWSNGRVILSWDNVERGVTDFSDGQNVVLHEFSHQLDSESGSTNGAPPLGRNSYKAWAAVFSENFEDLRDRSRRQQDIVMDEYGATNPAEFFAVATETFFEKPHQLYKRRKALYEELSLYYQLDPRSWQAPDGRVERN